MSSYLHGQQFAAGLGVATVLPDIDFETYSEAGYVFSEFGRKWIGPPGAPGTSKGLTVVGAAQYAAHASTEVLCAAYDLKDGRGSRHWRPDLPPPEDLLDLMARGSLIEAWNVGFERWIWTLVCARRYGWRVPHVVQWRCAMAKARAFALPPSLGMTGDVLCTPVQKDKEGARLLKLFSMPRNATGADPRLRVLPTNDPNSPDYADTQKLYEYNDIDIQAEEAASLRIPDLAGENLTFWQLDQIINVRGAPVDRQGILDCCELVTQCLLKYNTELLALTGIDAASKTQQIVGWLRGRGIHLDSLDEEHVDEALTWDLDADSRRVLEIRQANGSASVKKVFSMALRMTADDRLHDLYNFYGARTGRPTGEGPQPTNLPKAGPNVYRCGYTAAGKTWAAAGLGATGCGRYHGMHTLQCRWCAARRPAPDKAIEWCPGAAEDALVVMRGRSLVFLEWMFGDALLTIAGCLRGLYRARRGYKLVSSDYSAIEAVVAAMLGGVKWREEVFRTHGKIYEASAAEAFGVPLDDILAHKKTTGQHHSLRALGKVLELACGFGGWINSMKAFGAPGSDDELKQGVLAWRAASPGIEWMWGGQTRGKADGVRFNAGKYGVFDKWDRSPEYFGIEGAIVQAIQHPDVWYAVDKLDGEPSGLRYRMQGGVLYCELPSGRLLHYHNPRLVAQTERPGYSVEFDGYNTNPKNGRVGWITIRSWGSRFFENVVQAVAHDIQRYGMLNLEAAGYSLVMHTYDENVSEVPEGFGSVKEFEDIMNRMPPWAAGWPIRADGGWMEDRYRKA